MSDFELLLKFGYLGVLIALYIEHVMPPLPTNAVLPVAGYMVGRGEMNFWGVLLAAVAGGVLGSLTLYVLGRWMGEKPIRKYAGWLKISDRRLEQTFDLARHYGNMSVFALHAVPISPIRVVVSVMAGVNRLSSILFTVAAWCGTFIWISITLYITAYASEKWGHLIEEALEQQFFIILGTLVFGAIFLVWLIHQFKDAPSES